MSSFMTYGHPAQGDPPPRGRGPDPIQLSNTPILLRSQSYNFPSLVQPQCNPKITVQMVPILEAASVTASPIAGCCAHSIGTAVPALENWIGLVLSGLWKSNVWHGIESVLGLKEIKLKIIPVGMSRRSTWASALDSNRINSDVPRQDCRILSWSTYGVSWSIYHR